MPRPFSSARSPENSSSSSTILRTVDALSTPQQPRADPRAEHHADDRGHGDGGEHRALVEVDPRGRRVDQRQDEARRSRGDLERCAHQRGSAPARSPSPPRARTSRRGRRCSVNSTSPCGVRCTCQAESRPLAASWNTPWIRSAADSGSGAGDVGQLGLLRQRHQRDDRQDRDRRARSARRSPGVRAPSSRRRSNSPTRAAPAAARGAGRRARCAAGWVRRRARWPAPPGAPRRGRNRGGTERTR